MIYLNKEEIVKNRMPVIKRGIYFLIKENEIVYIGQATRLFARIGAHKEKDFDYYFYQEIENQYSLDEIETYYIIKFNPIYNSRLPGRGKKYANCSKIKDFIRPRNMKLSDLKRLIKINKINPIWDDKYDNNTILSLLNRESKIITNLLEKEKV